MSHTQLHTPRYVTIARTIYQYFYKHPQLDYLLLLFLGLLTYSFFLGGHPLLVPDEGRYSEIAREMVANHQYMTPQLNSFNFFDKPILFYWLQAVAFNIFGIHIWVTRLIPMLFGISGALIVYNISAYVFNRQSAWLAALFLLSSPLYFGIAHFANLDIEVAVWITASLSFFLRSYRPNTHDFHAGWLYAAYAAAGAAILTKGLMGIVFPIMIIGLWICITNQWQLVLRMRLMSGLSLVCAIVLPWFIFMQWQYPHFFNYFFYQQQFLRYTNLTFNNPQPTWYYVVTVFTGMLPWSLFLYGAYKHCWRTRCNTTWFLMLWPLIILVFFSIPQSKLIGYIIPVLPPLAILIGHYYPLASAKSKQITGWIFLLPIAIGSVILCFIPMAWLNQYGITSALKWLIVSAGIVIASALFYSLRFRLQQLSATLIIAGLVCFNILLTSYSLLTPQVFATYFPIYSLVSQLKPALTNSQVVMYYNYYQDLPFYLQKTVIFVHPWSENQLAGTDTDYGTFSYSYHTLSTIKPLTYMTPAELAIMWHSNQRVILFTNEKHLQKLARDVNTPAVRVIAHIERTEVVSNMPLP